MKNQQKYSSRRRRFRGRSGWEGVNQILKNDGYNVAVVQNPTVSLADDVAFVKRAIQAQNRAVILVGHSYGGVVVTEAGKDPQVKALVYIAGFVPDEGESVAKLIEKPALGAPVLPPITPPQDGFLFVDRARFHESFAGDLDEEKATFVADSQVPWSIEALTGTVT
jgi:pimeloyl-ACP methyl ester carboxylesterase